LGNPENGLTCWRRNRAWLPVNAKSICGHSAELSDSSRAATAGELCAVRVGLVGGLPQLTGSHQACQPPPRDEEKGAERRGAPSFGTVVGLRDVGWWPRAIASTRRAGVRDESQPGFVRADPHGGVAVRPTVR
jgi:hypothetical protein